MLEKSCANDTREDKMTVDASPLNEANPQLPPSAVTKQDTLLNDFSTISTTEGGNLMLSWSFSTAIFNKRTQI